jgi:hypothetical protein
MFFEVGDLVLAGNASSAIEAGAAMGMFCDAGAGTTWMMFIMPRSS